MLNKKKIAAMVLSGIMVLTMGAITAKDFASANEAVTAKTPFDLINVMKEEASLLVEQNDGSNQVKLVLELNEEYTKSITSLDLRIQLEPGKFTDVILDGTSTSTQSKSTFDSTTGILRMILVNNQDLIDNQKVALGTLTLLSEQTSEVTTTIRLEALSTVNLLHKKKTLTVNRTEHTISYTPSELDSPNVPGTPNKPSTPNEPSTPNKPNTPTVPGKPSEPNTPSEPEEPTTPSIIKVESIQLNKSSSTLKIGDTLKLSAKVLPVNATKPSLTWTSSNTSVVTVSKNGKVTAVGKGTATITAMSTDGSKVTANVEIKVKNVKVTSVKLSHSEVTLSPKETIKLKATILPANATNKKLVWTSSNKKVATVTKKGRVKAKAKGTTTITVQAKGATSKVKIIVK